jgi:hypothetical protein
LLRFSSLLDAAPDDVSGGHLEQSSDEFCLRSNVAAADVPNLPFPDHGHRLVACQRSSSRSEAAKAKSWTGQSFHVPMALLNDTIRGLQAVHIRVDCTARSNPAGRHAPNRHLKTLETGTQKRSKLAPDHAANRHPVTA